MANTGCVWMTKCLCTRVSVILIFICFEVNCKMNMHRWFRNIVLGLLILIRYNDEWWSKDDLQTRMLCFTLSFYVMMVTSQSITQSGMGSGSCYAIHLDSTHVDFDGRLCKKSCKYFYDCWNGLLAWMDCWSNTAWNHTHILGDIPGARPSGIFSVERRAGNEWLSFYHHQPELRMHLVWWQISCVR